MECASVVGVDMDTKIEINGLNTSNIGYYG